MEKPNLFKYATKELSQDAMICWLIECAAYDADEHLCQLGKLFVHTLLGHRRNGAPIELNDVNSTLIYKQEKGIDVLAQINDKHVLLIEDKIDSSPHNNQLHKYRERVLSGETELGPVAECNLCLIYFKTGNHSIDDERNIEETSEYKVFNRWDFLKVLNSYRGDHPIVKDYREHLQAHEDHTNSFRKWRKDDEENRWWEAWKGLYRELEQQFLNQNAEPKFRGWDYVPNKAGGFIGFWWCPKEINQDEPVYLQLEQSLLTFKVSATKCSKEEKQNLKWKWHEQITKQHEKVIKPKVMRIGNYMTVAVHKDGWLRFDKNGILDLEATVGCLREAERILIAATKET